MRKKNTRVTQLFESKRFGCLHVIGTRHDPLFCFSEVCKAIDCKCHGVIKSRLEEDGGKVVQIPIHTDGKRLLNFTNEQGVFTLLASCTKPVADEYRQWICDEVLPIVHNKKFCSDLGCIETVAPLIESAACPDDCSTCTAPCAMKQEQEADYAAEIANKVADILKEAFAKKDEEVRRKEEALKKQSEQLTEQLKKLQSVASTLTSIDWS